MSSASFPLIKICGLCDSATVDAVCQSQADMMGLVFVDGSRRALSNLDVAAQLAARGAGKIKRVGLFSNPSDAALEAVLSRVDLDLIQLHGQESVERAGQIRGRYGLPLIKAFSIAEEADFAVVESYTSVASYYLFDARPPEGAKVTGGHGQAFNWRLLSGRRFSRPWLLAGGLRAETVQEALQQSGALAIDVSSGVEGADGQKSPALIHHFVQTARQKFST